MLNNFFSEIDSSEQFNSAIKEYTFLGRISRNKSTLNGLIRALTLITFFFRLSTVIFCQAPVVSVTRHACMMSSRNAFNGRIPLAVNVICYARVAATKVAFTAHDITGAV